MKRLVMLGSVVCSATLLFGATAPASYVDALKSFLVQNSFNVNGEFYAYDFEKDGKIDYNDWLYLSLDTGEAYRLLAIDPSPTNAFGFAPVQKPQELTEPDGYFIYLDFGLDNDKKFSWVYVSHQYGSVYKLMGATADNHFDYLDIDGNGSPDPLPGLTYTVQTSTLPGSVAMKVMFSISEASGSVSSMESSVSSYSSFDSSSSYSTSSDYSSYESSSSSYSSSYSSEYSSEYSSYSYSSVSSTAPTLTLPQRYTPNDGRLLAAGCYQCHGTNGYSTNKWDSIAGEDMDEFYDDHPLMRAQAQGYTLDEVRKIFDWLRTLPEYEGGESEYGEYDDDEHDDD